MVNSMVGVVSPGSEAYAPVMSEELPIYLVSFHGCSQTTKCLFSPKHCYQIQLFTSSTYISYTYMFIYIYTCLCISIYKCIYIYMHLYHLHQLHHITHIIYIFYIPTYLRCLLHYLHPLHQLNLHFYSIYVNIFNA